MSQAAGGSCQQCTLHYFCLWSAGISTQNWKAQSSAESLGGVQPESAEPTVGKHASVRHPGETLGKRPNTLNPSRSENDNISPLSSTQPRDLVQDEFGGTVPAIVVAIVEMHWARKLGTFRVVVQICNQESLTRRLIIAWEAVLAVTVKKFKSIVFPCMVPVITQNIRSVLAHVLGYRLIILRSGTQVPKHLGEGAYLCLSLPVESSGKTMG